MFSSQNSQVSNNVNYIEDVFSTYLYTGNGSTQTITNGIDLAGEGGLVWIKRRNGAYSHALYDTNRGVNLSLSSNTTGANVNQAPDGVSAFDATGFSLNGNSHLDNNTTGTYASWTFREQPKFFDIVTYTGNGTAGRTVVHNLGSVPGCIIVKRTDTGDAWAVYHRGVNSGTGNGLLVLNTTAAQNVNGKFWWGDNTNFIAPTSTNFTVSTDGQVNASGNTYVAYVFAHDAGGFGLTGTDNVISCGSFTTNGSGIATVNLGYEPQLVLYKASSAVQNWEVYDTMRGITASAGSAVRLAPNLSDAEADFTNGRTTINATGFSVTNLTSTTYIYIAIRRGPMKVPELGTSVFNAITRTGTGTQVTVSTTIAPDMVISTERPKNIANDTFASQDKLRGAGYSLFLNKSNAETNETLYGVKSFGNSSIVLTSDTAGGAFNYSTAPYVEWIFKRAPGFFDEVCYTGTGSASTVAHNLGVAPELIIVKARNRAEYWICYQAALGNAAYVLLNSDGASSSGTYWNNTSPTSSVFSVSGNSLVGGPYTYVAYLFATCPEVSKVGSYTGTGALQTVACGFTSGARFVLIKRTDATGDWYVWDSARGITSGNDPYLLINSTAAEVTATNYVDTDTTGFKVTAAAPAGLNASGGTYIFLAIA